ncbi:hypothetical protein M3J09_010037 [Ascochyta lentis]
MAPAEARRAARPLRTIGPRQCRIAHGPRKATVSLSGSIQSSQLPQEHAVMPEEEVVLPHCVTSVGSLATEEEVGDFTYVKLKLTIAVDDYEGHIGYFWSKFVVCGVGVVGVWANSAAASSPPRKPTQSKVRVAHRGNFQYSRRCKIAHV